MSNQPFCLGIDQGSSGSCALILNPEGQVCGYGYRPLAGIHPHPGWIEHDPNAVTMGVAESVTEAIERAGCRLSDIAGCGIACQRNTDFAWDAQTGQAVANVISWQDLRTLPMRRPIAWRLIRQSAAR